ncbi:hypothetical protein C1H46_017654 [Malus baccata]|uniref:Uncharacterized protein n=1 Tax=Malus baccata TaxID=106549 RepID=A0A540MDG1_MALBA|nr:hypothetical protein C1H46_017654 [Malus baccata]
MAATVKAWDNQPYSFASTYVFDSEGSSGRSTKNQGNTWQTHQRFKRKMLNVLKTNGDLLLTPLTDSTGTKSPSRNELQNFCEYISDTSIIVQPRL